MSRNKKAHVYEKNSVKRLRARCLPLSRPRDAGDAETGEQVEVNTSSARVRKEFNEANTKRIDELERNLRQRGIDYLHAGTGAPYMLALRAYFKKRSSRR